MGSRVGLAETRKGSVGIDRSGIDVGVPKKLLNVSDVSAVIHHVGGAAMSEDMWANVLLNAGRASNLPYRSAYMAYRHTFACTPNKQGGFHGSRRNQHGGSIVKPPVNPFACTGCHRHHAGFCPFTLGDHEVTSLCVDIVDVGGHKLGNTYSGSIEKFQNGAVPARGTCQHHGEHLVFRQELRYSTGNLGGSDQNGWVVSVLQIRLAENKVKEGSYAVQCATDGCRRVTAGNQGVVVFLQVRMADVPEGKAFVRQPSQEALKVSAIGLDGVLTHIETGHMRQECSHLVHPYGNVSGDKHNGKPENKVSLVQDEFVLDIRAYRGISVGSATNPRVCFLCGDGCEASDNCGPISSSPWGALGPIMSSRSPITITYGLSACSMVPPFGPDHTKGCAMWQRFGAANSILRIKFGLTNALYALGWILEVEHNGGCQVVQEMSEAQGGFGVLFCADHQGSLSGVVQAVFLGSFQGAQAESQAGGEASFSGGYAAGTRAAIRARAYGVRVNAKGWHGLRVNKNPLC